MANRRAMEETAAVEAYEETRKEYLRKKAEKEEARKKAAEPQQKRPRGRPRKDAPKPKAPPGTIAPGSNPAMAFKDRIKALPGENQKYLMHNIAMWDWDRPDMMDTEAIASRIRDYFVLCAEDDMRPSVEGLAVAFDCDRRQIWRWANEPNKARISERGRQLMAKAYALLNAQTVDLMQSGKINPVSAIFLLKNNQGYEDKTEMVVRPETQNVESSPEQIEQYLSTTADVLPD